MNQHTKSETTIMTHFYFEIQVDEPKRAQVFYGELFNWKFEKIDGLPLDYWHVHTGGMFGGMLKRPADTPPPGCGTNAFVNSIEVDDFDAMKEKIKKLGGKVALPKFAVPGRCWQGYFLDTEGNTFGLFEVDENAK